MFRRTRPTVGQNFRASVLAAALEPLEIRRLLAADVLDQGFGNGGLVLDPQTAPDAAAVAVNQSNGNIAVVGSGAPPTVAQYGPNGAQNWSHALAGFEDVTDVAVDPDGNVVVVGTDPGQDFIVARYTDAGALDTSFAGDGTFQHVFPGDQEAFGVALRPVGSDYQIVVVGDNNADDFAVLQLDSAGQLAPFNSPNDTGFILIDVGSTGDRAKGVALQTDGTAVIVGETLTGGQRDYALVRLTSTGTVSSQTITDNGAAEMLTAVAVGNGDAIYASGSDGTQGVLVTYGSTGVFGAAAAVPGLAFTGGVAVDGDGNVYVAGITATFDALSITRFTPGGAPDTGFGDNGNVAVVTGGTQVITFDVALQADNKPVAFGASDDNYALARWGNGGGSVVTAVMQGSNLVITGTAQADDVRVARAANGDLKVSSGNTLIKTVAVAGMIVLNGGEGADDITISNDVPNDSLIHGDAGDDIIRGGGGDDLIFGDAGHDKLKAREAHDILVGGTGEDTLAGGEGRDLLLGGADADKIAGQDESDIIVSGTTSHDADNDALYAIQTEWLRTDNTASQRRTNIRDNGVGAGNYKLSPNNTVFDDNARDTLSGGTGSDWFLANTSGTGTLDKITDLSSLDFIDDLAFILA